MEIDLFVIFCKLAVLFVYGGITIVGIIFTFFIDTYIRLDEWCNLEFLSQKIINPLERNISAIDDWLIAHNKIVGPLLTLLSLLDIGMFFKIIDLL